MTKKGSSKKLAKPSMEDPAVEKEKYSTKPKKMGSEIDDIFAGKKRKKPEKDEKADSEKTVKVLAANAKSHDGLRKVKNGKSKSLKDSGIDEPTSRSRKKRTADGLSIYTEEELGIGKPEAGEGDCWKKKEGRPRSRYRRRKKDFELKSSPPRWLPDWV